jgi:myo-inositol 2-dehydrogenase / D-chiro-inositol 1-dehydrogenase
MYSIPYHLRNRRALVPVGFYPFFNMQRLNVPRIKVGLVGAGAVASAVHLPILTRRSDLFEVIAIADLNLAATHILADRFGIPREKCFDSPPKLISDSGVDAIMVLNSGSHAEVVASALKSGLNVFCEKPLAYTKREMNEIENALKSSGKQLMIGYMKTFDNAVIAAKNTIKSRPRTVDVLVLHPSGESQLVTSEISVDMPSSPKALNEIFAKIKSEIQIEALGEYGAKSFGNLYTDIVLGSVIHEFSVLRALDVHITEVDFVDRWPSAGNSEAIIIHARTADGIRVTIRWFYLDQYPAYQEEIRWVNEEEGHHIIFPSPYILRIPTQLISTRRRGIDHEVTRTNSYSASFENELVAFHSLVLTGKQEYDPISDGYEDLEIAQMIAKKIAEREGIHLGGDIA